MADVQTSFPPLVVGTDVPTLKRAYRPVIVFSTVMPIVIPGIAVAVAAFLASASGFAAGMVAGLGIVVSGITWSVMASSLAYAAGARAVMGTVLTLDHRGMEWRLVQGVLILPWNVVDTVSVRSRAGKRILTYRLVAGVGPASPGVGGDLPEADFHRVAKRGAQLGSVGIDVPVDTILAATAAFTGGRLTPR
ncbi:hypothetical protein [Labedella endophytica]|uniref:Uncharacterized protein n=1 Tax=Labedella endophytica TaxID=1523160 RepID=A0A3S0X3N8_9MICO|nr:hypothetical protein [Labedella endophytica]RUQ96938.1 hypothetical protein ELQ94_16965 [Labedella endophytica]